MKNLLTLLIAVALGSTGCNRPPQTKEGKAEEKILLRFGHFPNITHAQGVVAHHLSRQGKGWYEERIGPNVEIQWFTYNAGPSAMEAIFANSIDVTYVGPGPAINAYIKSRGEDIRIIANAATGGAALEGESNGKIFLEETDAVTTRLVSSRKFLEKQRDLARKIYAAHVELTQWIIAHPDEASKMLQAEIAEETKVKIPIELIQKSWKRLVFTEKITIDPINKAVADAKAAGFIKDTVDMARILETP
jgi:ABC-type nitrate/sulfonate/bicarbonate transport system substrate-binding protein